VTVYGLEDRGSIPGSRNNFIFSMESRLALGLTQTPIERILPAISWGVKLPERAADHSPASSIEVKNGGTIPPVTHLSSRRGATLLKLWDKFTFYILKITQLKWRVHFMQSHLFSTVFFSDMLLH
jgi:hypothetical protein